MSAPDVQLSEEDHRELARILREIKARSAAKRAREQRRATPPPPDGGDRDAT